MRRLVLAFRQPGVVAWARKWWWWRKIPPDWCIYIY